MGRTDKNIPNKNEQGFTLVELLIYISITTLIMVALTSFVADVTKQASRTKVSKEVQQNARLIITKITQDVRTADSVTQVTPTQIDLVKAGQAISYSWDSVGKTVNYNDGTGNDPLSNGRVSVTSLQFTESNEAINIALDVEQKNPSAKPAASSEISLSSTAVPRSALY